MISKIIALGLRLLFLIAVINVIVYWVMWIARKI
jgi:hypothetical protein